MASFNLLTLVGLKQKQIISASETVDFLSIKVGASSLEIKETAGAIDFGSANLLTSGTVDGRDVSTDGTVQDAHIANTSNPHSVTKAQVGLGSVTNDLQLKASDLDNDTSLTADSATKVPTQHAVKTYVDSVTGGTEFLDSAFRIKDNGDATKKMAFEVSAITTGTTRTVTMPDTAVNLGLIATAIQSSEKGASNGVATLDSGGKVPVGQLPNSVMEYKGTWNATTNTPTLADGTGSAGDVYRVSVAGTQNLGSGAITYVVGDYVIYNGSTWEKSHSGADAVTSVNGATGVVVLTTSDISEGTNLYYTTARFDTRFSSKSTTDLTEGTNLYYTDERAQDAIGAALTDTATIDFTYNDGANTIIADVKSNSISETHLTTSVAGNGLAGGNGTPLSVNTGNGTKIVSDAVVVDSAKSFVNDNAGTITVRQVVYVKSNGHVDKALASTISDDTELGLVEDATIATTATGKITFRRGEIVGGFSGLTPGKKQLVSRASAGVLVEDLTGFVAGEMVFSVGRAASATEIAYDPHFLFEF